MNAQQLRANLLTTKEANYGFACTNCMQPGSTNLSLCSGCNRVCYCSAKCQRDNWHDHKPACRILQSFQRWAPHMIEDTSSKCSNPQFGILTAFTKFETMVKVGVLPKGRDLPFQVSLPKNVPDKAWLLAKDSIRAVPFCSICHKHPFQNQAGAEGEEISLPRIKWKNCPRCNFGWCCKEHWKEYEPKHTKEICDMYIKAIKIDRFLKKHTSNEGTTFLLNPETVRSVPLKRFPENWDEYFDVRVPECPKYLLPYEFFPAATVQLSQAVTCLYAMHEIDKTHFKSLTEITIHLIDPDPSFELEGGGPTCIWEEIMHCLPSVKTLNMVFIGPDSVETGHKRFITCCPTCQRKGRKRSQGFAQMHYHEYYDSEYFTKPDLVVGFNTGLHERKNTDRDWIDDSINVILDLDVPCVFTAYDLSEATKDTIALRELGASTSEGMPKKNPFPVDLPVIDSIEVDGFFQLNNYVIFCRGRNRDL